MDVEISPVDGITATRAIRERDAHCQVVILSQHSKHRPARAYLIRVEGATPVTWTVPGRMVSGPSTWTPNKCILPGLPAGCNFPDRSAWSLVGIPASDARDCRG